MHIDSRNLSPDSLLGKALDQIDTDNDGEIEQVSLYSPLPCLSPHTHPQHGYSFTHSLPRSALLPRSPPSSPSRSPHTTCLKPQHELDAFIKHTVRDQVAVKNLKRSLVAMTMLLVAMLVVVFAMGFAAIQASKESHVYV